MGFRGEALFSMACVSDQLVVATRTDEEDVADKLVFGRDGELLPPPGAAKGGGGEGVGEWGQQHRHRQPIPRKVGTTVAVVRPFAALPARRADLMRRIRGERTKIFKLVEAYGVFNVGVCFNLIDIVNKPDGTSREETVLATSASSKTLQETSSAVLGPKFVRGVTAVRISLDPILRRIYGENCHNWGIHGLVSTEPGVSTASSAGGRDAGGGGGKLTSSGGPASARTVQYYSINGRVVDLPKVTALLKRLWTTFGGKKKPSAILAFTLPNEAFDINLAPDKQTVLLTHEKDLLGLMEDYMTDQWSNQSSAVFAVNSQQPRGANAGAGTNGGREDDVEGDDDDDDDDDRVGEDGERQMHKRRFAFVNDLSNAKMQHDLDGRRRFDGTRHVVDTPSQLMTEENDGDNDEAGHPVKKARVSLDSSGKDDDTARANDDHPTEDTMSPRTSDLERRQWNEIQAAFRRRDSDEDFEPAARTVIQAIDAGDSPSAPVSPDDLSPGTSLRQGPKSRHHEATISQISSVNQQTKEREKTDHKAMTAATTNPVTPSKLQTSLLQFAFQASGTGADTKKSDRVSEPGGRTIHEILGPCKATKSGEPSSEKTEPSTSQASQESLPKVKARAAQTRTDGTSQDSGRIRVSSVRTIVPEPVPLLPICEDEKLEGEALTIEKNISDKGEEITPVETAQAVAEGETAPKVVWDAFSSTEQVCQSARLERLQMRTRKRDIGRIRRNLVVESKDPNTTMDKTVKSTGTIDLGDGKDEISRDVRFDEDGNDGSDPLSSTSASFIRISKSTFRGGMQVIGQFNLGFILAKCARNHLWILDQHGCDEKYNFEQLCKNTVIHEQPLIKPLPLELTPMEEACVLDHMEIFQANGFRFAFDADAPIRHRLSLTALPHSGAHEGRKAVQFGPSDVSALCSILTEGSSYDPGGGGTGTDGSGKYGNNAVRRHARALPGLRQTQAGQGTPHGTDSADRILARLPKAIAMFASRACRTSIMIGTALSQREMDNVVHKLAEVDHPFTCAHGRPTMRHVGDLLPLLWQDERRAAEHIAGPTITLTPMTQPETDG